MTIVIRHHKFWWQWIAANSLAELIGLGSISLLGYSVVTLFGEPHGFSHALVFAVIFILSGALEGLVVGYAQAQVLRLRLPQLHGWIRATVIGAVVAWALGMVPSTLMNIADAGDTTPPPEISEWFRLLFASGLGLVTGPVLAFFQWRCLRHYLPARSGWWLPANALAWAGGMPLIFAGAHLSAFATNPLIIIAGVGLTLLFAGALVGAVHGRVLLWILDAQDPSS